MMRGVDAPMARAAAIKSSARTCMVALRVTTAKRSQSSRPSTAITICMELPMNAATASATRITGSASRSGFD
jgi:hypothetical protein